MDGNGSEIACGPKKRGEYRMEKSIKITAILSGVLYTLSSVFSSVLMPIFVIFYRGYGGFDSEGAAVIAALSVFRGFLAIVVMIIFMILMIHASDSMNEGIGVEVTGLVLIGGLGSVFSLIGHFILTYFSRFWGAEIYAGIAAVNNAQSFVSPIISAAITLLIASFVISICRKKVVIPLLYDKGLVETDEDSQV